MYEENNKARTQRVGFIGAGKVGFSLGKYFAEHNIKLSGYYSRHIASTMEAAIFTSSNVYTSLRQLVESSDTIFLTVKDEQIQDVWNEMVALQDLLKDKIICHTSGALSSEIFSGIDRMGAYGFSVHPLLAISNPYESYKELSKCIFTIEYMPCSARKKDHMLALFEACDNVVQIVSHEKKVLYHLAAVFASNFTLAIANCASKLFEESGLEKECIKEALLPLMQSSLDNIEKYGIVDALTGPIERGDLLTVQRHMEAIESLDDSMLLEQYRLLSKELLLIASEKHKDREYIGVNI